MEQPDLTVSNYIENYIGTQRVKTSEKNLVTRSIKMTYSDNENAYFFRNNIDFFFIFLLILIMNFNQSM